MADCSLEQARCPGLVDEPSSIIRITVPASKRPARVKIPGIAVHRSNAILRTRHPAMLPPCTRVEDTVLDLIQIARTFDDAYAWICKAIGRRRTTADRIALAMAARKKMRWRREIGIALGVVVIALAFRLEPGPARTASTAARNVSAVRSSASARCPHRASR